MPEPKELLVQLLTDSATLPSRGSDEAVGYDIYADIWIPGEQARPYDLGQAGFSTLYPGERHKFSTGIAVAVPEGYEGKLSDRSGLAAKNGITVLGGVIDPDYTGEVFVVLLNTGRVPINIQHGDRICQLVLHRVTTPAVKMVQELPQKRRGAGGFGSTGA